MDKVMHMLLTGVRADPGGGGDGSAGHHGRDNGDGDKGYKHIRRPASRMRTQIASSSAGGPLYGMAPGCCFEAQNSKGP